MRARFFTARKMAGAAVLAFAAIAGCRDFLDVNENPNAPEQARVDIRLPALIAMFVHSTYYGETSLWGAEWTQQFSYNRDTRPYAEVHRYELAETDATTAWDYFYTRPTHESSRMVSDASGEADVYYRGIGRLFRAWSFQVITDLWGPIPYTEAFDPLIREPKYDDQETVYAAILQDLAGAVTDLSSPTGRRPTTNDLLFNGDLTRWVKLAHFLEARANLRLAYAPGQDKVARANSVLTALSGAMVGNADDVDFIYPGGANARNPLYTFQELRNQLVASEFFISLLQGRSDPRLSRMFTPIVYDSIRGTTRYPSNGTRFVGHRNGSATLSDSTVSWVAPFYSNENANLSVVSYADQKFTEAEAQLIVNGAAAADVPYRAGITAHMQKLGVAAAAISTYLAARPALNTLPSPLQEIITEKYIANFLKVEAWNDWRRTRFPTLQAPVEQAMLTGIPERIRTPGSELSNNINQVQVTGIPTGLEGMLVKVWWATLGPT